MEKLKILKKKARNGEGEWTSSFSGEQKVNLELKKLTSSAGWVAAGSRKMVSSAKSKSPSSSRASTPSNTSSTGKKRGRKKKKDGKQKFKMVLEKDDAFEVDYVSPEEDENTEDSEAESKPVSDVSEEEFSVGEEEDDLSSLEDCSVLLDDDFSDIEPDEDLPALELPESSRDLLVPNHLVLPALGIYETLRHFRSLLRISPMLFEDFCAALVDESTNILLTECYIAVLKSILREEDAAGTQFGPPDQKDSKDTAFSFLDHMTWPEITRAYLESTGDHSEALQIIRDPKFPRVRVNQKILVLKTLTDIYLASNKVRDKLMTDGVIHYDDHCRVCHKLGDLLCCETCPAVYHLACCDPPLAEVPDDEWQCEICRVHKLNGVFNCEPRHEFKGQYLRHDPIGVDRHGNKYWFLVRRLIVEESEGIRYYTTQEQFESLRSVLDPERYEMVLCEALKDIADDFQKYSCITCDLTEEAVPDEKTSLYLNALNARVKREQDEKKRKREEEIKKKQEEEEKKRKEEEEAKKKQEEEEKKRKEEEEAKKKQEEDEKERREEEIKKKQEEEEKKGREEEEVKEKQEDEKNRMDEDDKKAESERLEEKKDAEGMDVDSDQVKKPEEDKNAEDQSKSTESTNIEQKKPADVGTDQTTASTDALTESKPSVATNASTATTSLPPTPVTPSSTITKIVTPSSTVTPTVPKIVVPGQTRNIQVIKLGQNVTPRPSQPVPTNLKTLFVLNKDGTRTPITLGPAGKILAAGNSQTPGNRQILVLNSAKVTLPKVNRELKKLQFTGAGPKTADVLNAQGQGPQLRQRIAVTKPAQEETPPAPKRPLTHDEESELYFKLGEDEGYRHYVNHYTDNTLALNKYQHKEERDRERYLSYKFSLSGEGEFKWMGDVLGNETTMLATLRNTLLHLEHQIPLCFMHTKWGRYRNAWGKMVMSCDTPQGFAAALGILEMATRVVVKRSIWKNSSGLTRLKRVTVGEKEDWDKKRKHRTRVEEDESNRNAIWCKYPFPLRCTLVWKGRGEEYRMTGYGGWMWISAARISKMRQSRKKPFTLVHDVTKDTVMDITSSENDKKDIVDLDTDSEKSTTSTVTTKSADLSEDRGIFDTLVQEATNQPIVTSPKTMTSSIVSMETKMTPSPVKSDVKIQLGGSENDNQTVTSSVNNDYTCDEIISSCDVINVSENLLKRTRLYNKKWAASKVDIFLGWRMVQYDKENPTKPTDSCASPAVTAANNVKQPEAMNKATNGPEVTETKPEIVPKIEESLGAMDVDPPVAGQGKAAVKQEALGPVVNGPNPTDSKSGLFTNEATTVSSDVNPPKSRTVCGGFAPTVIKAAATEHDENLPISTTSGANFVLPPNSDGVASTTATTAKTEATDLENFTVAAENGSHPTSASNSDTVASAAAAIIKTEATKMNESSPVPSAENKPASVEGNQPTSTSTSLSATNSDSVASIVATTFKTEATDLESLPISSADGNLTTSAPDSINTSNSASAMTKTDTNDSHVPTAQTQNTSDGPAPSRLVAGPQNTDSADKTRPVVVDPESKIIEIKEEYVPVQQPNGEVETVQNESATSAKSLGSLMEVAGPQAEITPVEPECLDGIKMETQALSQPNGDLDKNEGTSEPDIEATVDMEATGSSIGATSSTDCKTVMENQPSVDTSTLAKTVIDATAGTDAMASSIGAALSTESNTVLENELSMNTSTSAKTGIDAMTGIDATIGTDAMASSIGAALSTEPKSELGNVPSVDTSTSMKPGDVTTVGADATETNTMPESESSMDTSTSAMPGIDATASSIGATLCTESKTVLENELSMDTSTSVEPGIDATVGTDATASSIGAALSTESNTVPENESSIDTSTSAKPGIDATVGTDAMASSISAASCTESNTMPENESSMDTRTSVESGIDATVGTDATASSIGAAASSIESNTVPENEPSMDTSTSVEPGINATVGTDATASSIGAALSTESYTLPENESSIDTSTSAKSGIEATVGTDATASSIGTTSCTEFKTVPKNESFMDTSTSPDVASDIVTTEESMEVADSVIETTKTTMTEGNQVVTVVETQTTTITKTTSVTTTITSTNGGTKIIGTQATSGADNNVVEIAETTSTALSSGTTTSQLDDFAQQPTVSIEILPHLASTKHVALVTLPRIEFKQGKATVVSVQQRVRVSRMSRAQRILRKKNNSPLVPTQKTWKLERLKKTSAAQKKEMKLPLPWQFSSSKLNKKKSIFRLPAQILRKLAVSGGQFAYRAGFTFGAKWFSGLEQYWLYPCPRPTFSLTWRYKIQNVTTYATAAHLLRIFWHAIKWDKMTMRPQTDDVVHTITTDDEIITTELLKRKDDLRSGLHSEYFIRKISVPILDPEEEALRAIKPAEGYTPSRKGLRSRRSLMLRDRPNKSSETQVKEVWVSEEQVELWQIRQFDTMLKQQSQVNKPTNVLHSGGNTFVATPSGGILPTIQKRTEDAAGPGFSIVRLPLHQNAQMLQKSLGGVQSPLSPRSYIGKSPVQKIIVQPPKQQFTSYKTVGDKQAIIRSAQGGAQYIVQGGKLMKPIIIKAGSQIVTSTAQNKTPLRPQDQAFKFQQQPPIVPSFKKSPVIAPRAAASLPQTQIKLSTTQLASLLKAGSASPVKVSVTLGNGKSGVGQIQLIPPGSQVTPSSGQQLMQTRVGGEVRKFLFTLISEAAPAAPSPVNEVSLQTASLSQRLQQIHRRQLLGTNRNTDMKKLLTDKDPLWGSRPQAPDRTSISSHEAERPKRKGFSRLQREEGQRQTVVAQVMKSILDRIEKREELEMRKKKKEEAAMRKEQNEQIKVHNRQTQFLHKHRDQLRQEILKRRAIVEKYLTHAVKNELRDDQRKQRRSGSGSDLSLSPTSKRPKKSQGNAIVTSAVLTENNARRLLGKQAAAKRRRTNSPPPDSKKRKMISTTQIKKEGKLYCVCLTPYDPTKFYIGCDLCLNWFHGSCVGIPESRAKMMSEWICEECQKAKEEPAQELYCLCRTPYDDAKFYIGCDICQDWYHGGCVGVSEKEAETIDFYTCPRCIEKKRGESDRLEENLLTRSDRIELTKIIKSLRAHKMAWPFLQPVSKIEVPHYYNVIKKPMDLGTIMNKLSSYALLSELMGDVSLIFDNCRMFNGADSALAKCAEIVESVFVGKMREYRSRRKSSG